MPAGVLAESDEPQVLSLCPAFHNVGQESKKLGISINCKRPPDKDVRTMNADGTLGLWLNEDSGAILVPYSRPKESVWQTDRAWKLNCRAACLIETASHFFVALVALIWFYGYLRTKHVRTNLSRSGSQHHSPAD